MGRSPDFWLSRERQNQPRQFRHLRMRVAIASIILLVIGSTPAVAYSPAPTVEKTVAISGSMAEMAVDPTGVWLAVSQFTEDRVALVSVANLDEASPPVLYVSVGNEPRGLTFSADGKYLYVASSVYSQQGSLSVVDVSISPPALVATVTGVGDAQDVGAHMSDATHETVYIGSATAAPYLSSVSRTDIESVADASTPGTTAATEVSRDSKLRETREIAISPDGTIMFAGGWGWDYLAVAQLSGTFSVSSSLKLNQSGASNGTVNGIVFNSEGSMAYTSSHFENFVYPISIDQSQSPALVTRGDGFDMGIKGREIALTPDGKYVFVSTAASSVWIVDTSALASDPSNAGSSVMNSIAQSIGVGVSVDGKYAFSLASPGLQVIPLPLKTLSFSANLGSGVMADQVNNSATAIATNSFTRSGYTFTGWNSAADGTGTSYADSATYDFSANLTLYAQWTAIPAAPSSAAGSAASATPASNPVSAPEALPAPLPEAVSAPAAVTRAPGAAADRRAVAVVGGRQIAVTAQNLGERSARFGVGKVSVDIGVSESGGRVEGTGGIPSLKIARDQAATLKGVGLQPRSVLQVFLPATDGSFIELPSVDVGVDGSFVGKLTIGTSAREMPLPIGQRSIQMVGIDEDGNDTVLDIPITVAQPLPSPAVNRLSGKRPALEPGQLLVLKAGTPEIVDVDVVDNGANVSGDGWNIAVAGAPTETTTESLALKLDEPVAFSGAGFMPGTRADVWLFSDPTLLGTVDIADDGTFTADFAVDSNFVPMGGHTLQIQGVGTDGYVRAASLGVMVADPGVGSSGTSEADGFIWLPMTLTGASLGGLLILVAVGVAVRRRTRV